MPEEGEQGGSTTPAAQPASQPTTVQPQGDTAVADDFSKGVEGLSGVVAREPYREPTEQTPNAEGADPAPAGEPAPTEPNRSEPAEEAAQGASSEPAAKPEATAKAEPKTEPLPGDDELARLESLSGKPEAKPEAQGKSEIEPLETPEQIAKAINPTAKATLQEQLRNAQTLIGRQGNELGRYRKAIAELSPHFAFDDKGGVERIDVLGLAQAVGQEQFAQQLATAGFRLVPLDSGQSGQSEQNVEMAIAAQMIADNDLSPEDKLELVKADPEKLVELKMAKQAMKAEQALDAKARLQREETEVRAYWGEIEKLPHFDTLKGSLGTWHKKLPLDRPLTGVGRLDVLRRLAELDRMASVMKDVRDKAFAAGEKATLEKLQLTAIPGGEVPTYVSMSKGNQDAVVSEDTQREFETAALR